MTRALALLATLLALSPGRASAIQPLGEFLGAARKHNFDNREAALTAQSDRTIDLQRAVTNLGLLSDRVRPRYAEAGLLGYEYGKAAPELTAERRRA